RPPEAPQDQQRAALVDQLKARMEANPEDPRGWILLGQTEGQLGRYTESAEAYGRAIAPLPATRQPVTAILPSLQGEALTAAAGGQVTPAAQNAFRGALAI